MIDDAAFFTCSAVYVLGLVLNSAVRHRSIDSHIHPEELVVHVHQSQKDDAEEHLVIVVNSTRVGRGLQCNVFAINGSDGVGKVPSGVELVDDKPPLFFINL